MSKFSGRTATGVARGATAVSPVRSDVPSVTHEGGGGFLRDAKSELFLLAVTNMVGENTFYESGLDRDSRFRALVKEISLVDPAWIAGFVPYLRKEMFLRSAPLVMAAEFALARKGLGPTFPSVRQVVDSALQRPDEPAEFIGYWLQRTGSHTLPGGVQRGVADAVTRLYGEYAALKYDGGDRGVRMGDVIEMAHPTPAAGWQAALFAYLLDRRHNPTSVRAPLEELPMVRAWRGLQEIPVEQRRDWLRQPGSQAALRAAGMTWEDLSGWVNGALDASVWEAIVPSMGYMALLRNLRNFEQAGISQDAVAAICTRLADPTEVAKSKQFPFRFLSAFKNVNNLQWAAALETALNHSVANVPALPGRSLILIDCSGSMFDRWSERGTAQRYELAGLFGFALALRAESATTVAYGSGSAELSVPKGASILPLVRKLTDLGGTYTATAIDRHFAGHDRVIVLTDEQAHDGRVGQVVPANVPLYTFNVAGYRAGYSESGTPHRHTFGGLNDKAFAAIPLLERGARQDWPWLKG